jgi:hypothetical protein
MLLQAKLATDTWAELHASDGGVALCLAAADSLAQVTTGYSPHLHFDVADLDSTVVQLIQLGAELDGTIKHEPHGKMAALRTPDGHMIGLYEPASSSA